MGSTPIPPGDAISDGRSRMPDGPVYRFGPYELRTDIGQLSKHGIRLRLQLKPAQLLETLLETPGELVSRDALRQRLWPEGTFVDFEGSINTAINRLRAALNDAPDAPRYVETVPRLGYRFVHPVTREEPVAMDNILTIAEPVTAHKATFVPYLQRPHRRAQAIVMGLIAAAVASFAVYLSLPLAGGNSAPHFRQLTFHTGSIAAARFLPGLQSVAYTSLLPGGRRENNTIDFAELRRKPLALDGNAILSSVNERGDLAFVTKGSTPADPELLTMAAEGKQTLEVAAGVLTADWSPKNSDLAVVRHEGALSVVEFPRGHSVFSTRGWVSDLRVSPWGDRVAFLDHPARDDDGGFVEMVERNGHAQRVTPLWSSAAGLAWSASGREIWFSAGRDGATLSLFAVSIGGKVREIFGSPASVRLLDFSRAGDLLVTLDDTRMTLMTGGRATDNETDISKFDCSHVDAISHDGRLVLFTECGSAVGRHYTAYLRDLNAMTTMQLGSGRALALSPDGRMAITIDPQERNVLTMHDLATGKSRVLPNDGLEYQWARFLPGTAEILVGGSRNGMPLAIYRQCPDSGLLEKVDISSYLDDVVISSSGRSIAGMEDGRLRVFDWHTGQENAVPLQSSSLPLGWSADGCRLYAMNKRTLEISAIEVSSGNARLWRTLPGRDKPGFVSVAGAVIAPEAGVYAYSLHLSSSRLYLVNGLM